MKRLVLLTATVSLTLSANLLAATPAPAADPGPPQSPDLLEELKKLSFKIVYESYQDDNWELMVVNADGSHAVNLTKTPTVHEHYPHVSPDGQKVCFECDEGEGKVKRRNVYMMNLDGTGRVRVVEAGRDPCWTPDGKGIVYLKDEVDQFEIKDYATKGLFVYDVASGKAEKHVNDKLEHMYNVCCTPDGKWLVSTVHAGMGFRHAILAIDARGQNVYELHGHGCRPDVSPDGKKVAWGRNDWQLHVGELDFSGSKPVLANERRVMKSRSPMMIYHVDWSPDGKYFAFSRGAAYGGLGDQTATVGNKAVGWNICVADVEKENRWVQITTDGKSNKEPDWFRVAK